MKLPVKITISFVGVVALIIFIGFAIRMNAHRKVLLETGIPAVRMWEILTSVDSQVFWRTNLINVVRVKPPGGTAWKEIYKNDESRTYDVTENIPGERIVKAFRPDGFLQENFTIIVRPAKNGSSVALIDSVTVRNPVAKILYKIRLIDQRGMFDPFDEFVSLLTNQLYKVEETGGASESSVKTN